MIDDFAKDVQAKNKAGAKLSLPLVVYDLPDRDCAALASNGELSIANGGVNIYKTQYIDEIVKKINAYPDVFFTLVIGKRCKKKNTPRMPKLMRPPQSLTLLPTW